MPYIYDEATGKQIDVENVSGVVVGNKKREAVDAYYFGDTTMSRNKLGMVTTPLASTWDYMPKTAKDIQHAITLDTMVDGTALQFAKVLVGGIGGIIGGTLGSTLGVAGTATGAAKGASMGAGLGYLMVEAGSQIFDWSSKASQDPHAFWNDFMKNIHDRQDDTNLQKFVGGLNLGSKFSGTYGEGEGLYKEWGDMIGEKGFAMGAGEAIGTLVKGAATILAAGPTAGLVADVSLSSAASEAHHTIGLGHGIRKGIKAGALHGVASGVTGALFVGALPWLFETQAPQLVKAASNNLVASMATTGAEIASWQTVESNLIRMAEGKDFEFSPATFALSYGLGAAFGTLGWYLNKPRKMKMQDFEKRLEPDALYYAQDGFMNPKGEAIDLIKQRRVGAFATLERNYTPQESKVIADRILKADIMTGYNGLQFEEPVSLMARIRRDHRAAKQVDISVESASTLVQNYGVKSPELGRTWVELVRERFSTANFMKEKVVEAVNTSAYMRKAEKDSTVAKPKISMSEYVPKKNVSISKKAEETLAEKVSQLRKLGAITNEQQAREVADMILMTAIKDNKGSIGNYEIRKAFEKVMNGGN